MNDVCGFASITAAVELLCRVVKCIKQLLMYAHKCTGFLFQSNQFSRSPLKSSMRLRWAVVVEIRLKKLQKNDNH